MMELRQIQLPDGVSGALFASHMPGRCEALADAYLAMQKRNITQIVSLAPCEEIRAKSPDYHRALTEGSVAYAVRSLPIPNYGLPPDEDKFFEEARQVAQELREGQRILAHCGAGIGRTGMFAVCALIALGMGKSEAEDTARRAGSQPETDEQRKLVERFSAESERIGDNSRR
jgi:protein-tyrosine phosphatase